MYETKAEYARKTVKKFLETRTKKDICKPENNEDNLTIDGIDMSLVWGYRELSVYVGDDDEPFNFCIDIYGNRLILVENFF